MFVYLFNFSFGNELMLFVCYSVFFNQTLSNICHFCRRNESTGARIYPKQNFMFITECNLILWKSSARKFPNFPKFWKFSSGNLTPTPDSFPTSIFHMLSQCRYDNLIFLGQKMNLQKNMYIFLTLTKPWITVESWKVIHRWMEVLAINRN